MNKQKINQRIVMWALVIIGSILQSWHFLKTGWLTSKGVEYSQLHDSLWHLALIKEIGRGLPPQNPGLAGEPLSNYHYFSDLLLFIIHSVSQLSVENIYFHLAPPLVSALFISSIYIFSKILTKSFFTSIAASVFALFSGSAGFLIPLFKGHQARWYANSFMLDQPFEILSNIHSVLGLSVFIFASYFLVRYLKEKKMKYGVISGFLIGISAGIKAYVGIVGFAGLFTAFLYEIFIKKEFKLIIPLIVSGLLIFLAIHSNISSSVNQLQFAPGWVLTKMIEDEDRFYMKNWILLADYYQSSNNWIRLLLLNLSKIIVYLIGNLWIRLLSVFWFLNKLKKVKFLKTYEVFIIGTTLFSLSIPLFVIQTLSPHNTIQFSHLALVFLSILTAVWLGQQKKNKIAIFFIILFLSMPTTVHSFITKNKAVEFMNINEYESLKIIEGLPQDSIILTPPTAENLYLMKVAGLGGKRTYVSGVTFSSLTGTQIEGRVNLAEQFFSKNTTNQEKLKLLKDAKITHIYSNDSSTTKNLQIFKIQGFPISEDYSDDIYFLYSVQ